MDGCRYVSHSGRGLAHLFPEVGADLAAHRRALKVEMLERDLYCLGCGEKSPPFCEMHEGIISRQDVRGWDKGDKVLIHTPYNCLILCSDCNHGFSGKAAPLRVEVVLYMAMRYGYDVILWLKSLPFKAHPMKGLIEYCDRFGFYAGVIKWAQRG